MTLACPCCCALLPFLLSGGSHRFVIARTSMKPFDTQPTCLDVKVAPHVRRPAGRPGRENEGVKGDVAHPRSATGAALSSIVGGAVSRGAAKKAG